ncbi:hypothetical protein M3936_14210 [Sutcliffiella horikoshii]|uniref:hypothetical protein n=1 Tax=Sutcliffiella horikoshii TaxID=79883 RepID=UPI00204203F7|nr:hypothetical protein [Sutcliffiella horikoshii]MCM3618741.1 hypothetical protein [Sutcliffiella horikoshii]
MAKIVIKEVKKKTEIYIDGEPVKLDYLTEAKLDMNYKKGNTLTLTYHAHDVEVEIDQGEARTDD